MKQKTKAIIAISAAVVLLAGSATFAWYLKNRDRITVDTPLIGDIVTDLGDNPHLHLTAQADTPAAHGIQGDRGLMGYTMPMGISTGLYYRNRNVISYADSDTGTCVALCPKPNCLHDGSLFCTASTAAYEPKQLVVVDGKLYGQAFKHSNPTDGDHDSISNVLLEYAADGSSITELCTLEGKQMLVDQNFSVIPVAHRGYIWCVVSRTADTGLTSENPVTGDPEEILNGGFSIKGYEIATGKVVTLFETFPSDPHENVMYASPLALFGDGDSLYFTIEADAGVTKMSPVLKSGLNRINLETGDVEHIMGRTCTFVGEGYAIYRGKSATSYSDTESYLYNIETGDKISLGTYVENGIVAGGHTYAYKLAEENSILIADTDGTLLREVTLPDHMNVMNLAVDGDMFYVAVNGKRYREDNRLEGFMDPAYAQICGCKVEELEAGDPTWVEMTPPVQGYDETDV